MDKRTKSAVYGWIRENYEGVFLDDITDIIYQFYLIRINSNILSSDEQIELYNLLFDRKKTQKNNHNIKSMDTKLLFRGSEHGFDRKKFHEICDNQGPTVTIIHNENDHVFGGYVSISFDKDAGKADDPTAFLWIVRPIVKVYGLTDEYSNGESALWNSPYFGPKFGRGEDLWVGGSHNGCHPTTFEFDATELTGSTDVDDFYSFDVKEYEVFSVSFTS